MGEVFLIDPEFFSNRRNISLLLKVLTKLKKEVQVNIFLIPDPIYDFLTDLLKPFIGKIDEYSAEKWLTGIIPMDVGDFVKKIYSICKMRDVKKYSEIVKSYKLKNDDIMSYILDGFNRGFKIICLDNLCKKIKKKGLKFKWELIKGVKNAVILLTPSHG